MWTLSDDTLSVAAHGKYVAYDESYDPELIWVFGGWSSGCWTCVEYYNITDNTLTSYDTLHTGTGVWGRPGCAQIGGMIYYLSDIGEIHTYEIADKQQSTTALATIPDATNSGCLTRDPMNDNLLYILSGQSTNTFYIYNIASGNLTQGVSLTNARYQPTCAVSNWEDDPYLYVILGQSSYIERINLNTLDKWEVLSLRFDDNYIDGSEYNLNSGEGRLPAVVSFNQYIYTVTGYPSSADTDQVYYLDVENWELNLVGTFPVARHGVSGVYVKKTQRMYTFGGYDSGVGADSSIYYSNEAYFLPTSEPSGLPTSTPTNNPTAFVTTSADTTASAGVATTASSGSATTNLPVLATTKETETPATTSTTSKTGMTTSGPAIDITTTKTETGTTAPPSSEPSAIGGSTTEGFTSSSPTEAPSREPTVEPSDNSEQLDSGNNKNEIEDLTIVIVALSGVVSVCCIVALCIFGLSMGYCWKKEHRYNTIQGSNNHNHHNHNGGVNYQMRSVNSGSNVIEMQNGNGMSMSSNRGMMHTGMMNTNHIMYATNTGIAGGGENVPSVAPTFQKVQSLSAAPVVRNPTDMGNGNIVISGANNGIAGNGIVGMEDDELYMSPVNKVNNGGNVAQLNVDGKNVEINYQDLVNILSVKKENENDTTQVVAGEKLAEIEDE